jgi:hypothetical protein
VEDVSHQARGLPVEAPEDAGQRAAPPLGKLHQRLVDALTTSLICDIPTQRRRRGEAISAIARYCSVEEPLVTTKVVQAKPPPPLPEMQSANPKEELRKTVLVQQSGERCVVKALALSLNGARVPIFCRTYAQHKGAIHHFRTQHLDFFDDEDQTICPVCNIRIEHKKHFMRHAEEVYGLVYHARGWA